MAPRPRKALNPKSTDFGVRFGIHLRALLDKRKLETVDFIALIQKSGIDVAANAIRKWLSGDRLPRPQDAERIGEVLRLKDYREVWPPPR